uniref:Uncharacterized protein n=1 Tax=Tanacetum cinerariifolium TaxID=118510 RepID=A0A6L2LGD7_TANCI|nr:hypothetical protein [Tanacetum cinerariifolium]
MHNNITTAGSRDRPYQPTTVTILTVPATENSLAVPEQTAVKTILTVSPKNKAHYELEKEAIHLLLTGIEDEIYSTVDACKTAHEMWIAIERLQQVRIAKNANPLALVAAAQQYPEPIIKKPKRVKGSTYHKETMLLCKQVEKGVPLQAEQADWLEDGDEEIDEQELEAHYSFMAKIQEVPTADSRTDTEPLEQVHTDAEYNVFPNVRQHSEQPESTRNTCLVEKDNSNVTPDSSNMCDNDIQID